MATPVNEMKTKPSWRRFEDGDDLWESLTEKIFAQDTSHKCPTYVHKTPPCQGSCPSGEDIRGWLAIVRQKRSRRPAWTGRSTPSAAPPTPTPSRR